VICLTIAACLILIGFAWIMTLPLDDDDAGYDE
jgi:hypothetical protein